MLSDDGRVRVMDFGLARGDTGEVVAAGETGAVVSDLTQAGSITGTPAYMSLEQFEGTIVDARSDQFSFCGSPEGEVFETIRFLGAGEPASPGILLRRRRAYLACSPARRSMARPVPWGARCM